jgi:hypothetical protein
MNMDVSSLEDDNNKPQKAESLQERNERLAEEMQNAFNVLAGLGNHNKMCSEHFQRDCVVVDVPLLLKVFNSGCQCLSCSGTSQVENSKMEGGVLTISWKCSEGHLGCWTSSKVLCQKNGQNVHTFTLLMAAGIFISGNNYDKLALFCRFLGLGVLYQRQLITGCKHILSFLRLRDIGSK